MKELTLRSSAIGRPVATRVHAIDGQSSFKGTDRLIVLVHGFNVSEGDARKEYRKHEANLYKALGHLSGSHRFGTLCALHWPGDHPGGWPISALSFPSRIPDAQLCGERLARFLAALEPEQKVVLIAHSLGGQVVLNALSWIHEFTSSGEFQGATVTHAFLMAPAVEVRMCTQGQAYGQQLCEEHVFFSPKDYVLKLLFSPGSNTYTPVGSPAVGLKGEPVENRWSYRHQTQLGHGGYWKSGQVASDIVKAVLGYAPTRFLTELELSDREVSVGNRVSAPRQLDSRQVSSRS